MDPDLDKHWKYHFLLFGSPYITFIFTQHNGRLEKTLHYYVIYIMLHAEQPFISRADFQMLSKLVHWNHCMHISIGAIPCTNKHCHKED